jgi:hypothetical protein
MDNIACDCPMCKLYKAYPDGTSVSLTPEECDAILSTIAHYYHLAQALDEDGDEWKHPKD